MHPLKLRIPEGVKCACIFVAVARLAACEADPVGSAPSMSNRRSLLIDLLAARGIYTLFLSTNQVFGGDRPHVPADTPTSPVSEYGRQKAKPKRRCAAHGQWRADRGASPGQSGFARNGVVAAMETSVSSRTFDSRLHRHDDGADTG